MVLTSCFTFKFSWAKKPTSSLNINRFATWTHHTQKYHVNTYQARNFSNAFSVQVLVSSNVCQIFLIGLIVANSPAVQTAHDLPKPNPVPP